MVTGELPGDAEPTDTDGRVTHCSGVGSPLVHVNVNSDPPAVLTIRRVHRDPNVPTLAPEEIPLEHNPAVARVLLVVARRPRARCSPRAAAAASPSARHHDAGRRAAAPSGTLERLRLDVPADLRPGRRSRLPGREHRTSRSTTRRSARARARPTCRPRRSTSPAPTASRKPDDLSSYQGGTLLYFPTVAAPITVSYNLTGVNKLQLSGTTLAKIFSLQDQEVERRRDHGRQPRRDAAVDRRSPSCTAPTARAPRATSPSSSTAVDPTDWTLGSGDTVDWPSLGTRRAATRNAGVAQIVKQTDGAIGYVDLADATAAKLQHRRRSRTRPASSWPRRSPAPPPRSRPRRSTPTSRTTRSTRRAPTSYPITSPTWIIVYEKQTEARRRARRSRRSCTYIYGDGQGSRRAAGYAPLPPSVVHEGHRAARQAPDPRVASRLTIRGAPRHRLGARRREPAGEQTSWVDTSFRAVALAAGPARCSRSSR